MIFLNYLYTGKLRQSPLEVSTCVDHMCSHDACGPAINFAVELMYASEIFQIMELVSLFQDGFDVFLRTISDYVIFLDEAYALHYAVAYCDPKIVAGVLSLGLADVNLRDSRGYTALHVAARRKEPSIIVSLLNKGSCVWDPTLEGQSAIGICRRMTRPKDYQMKREKGQEANKDSMCIDLLEREMRRNPVAVEASISSLAMADDLKLNLLYLEDRVAFARMFFPTEAKLAMEIAHAETTSELTGLLYSRGSSGNLMEVDLNETPLTQNKRPASFKNRNPIQNRYITNTVSFFSLANYILSEHTSLWRMTYPTPSIWRRAHQKSRE